MRSFILAFCIVIFPLQAAFYDYDVVIYGGTPAGIMAAIQAKKMNRTVILLHPGSHIGGMTASGLGIADSNRHYLVGGLAKEFFRRIRLHYQQPSAWVFEEPRPFKDHQGNPQPGEDTQWVFEPHVAEDTFHSMLSEASVPVLFRERLNRQNGVQVTKKRITQITLESGNTYRGRMYIDATYEGDLMAAAGVSYFVGRESNTTYGEMHNGIQANPVPEKFPLSIDPYVIPGDPASGILPRIYLDAGGENGEGDSGVQAYCFRMCLTDVPENRIPIEKPKEYQEENYELLFRALDAGAEKCMKICPIPNRKSDCNNLGYVSLDYVGGSWNWAEADAEERQRIFDEHLSWQQGLLWTLQNHPRVPERIKQTYAPWGLPKDEFLDHGHWPHELYVREARRMVSDRIITEHTLMGKERIEDSVGVASYHIDSHNIKYYVKETHELGKEGGLYLALPSPFPISYGAIVPKAEECKNLLVPVCVSASHVGYAPIRMEPIYMILGQSAGAAAALAIKLNTPVQQVPYSWLRYRLLQEGQILEPEGQASTRAPNFY